MPLWGRILSAWNGAVAGWSGNSMRNLMPTLGAGYGTWEARYSRYNLARSYYNNEQYDNLKAAAMYLRAYERLYKFIRSIENVVPQENNLHIAYTYPGSINLENLKIGALPLVFDNPALEEPLRRIIKMSNLDQQLGSFVGNAALLGDSALWVSSDPVRGRVRVEGIEPEFIKHAERDEANNVKLAVIEYDYEDPIDASTFVSGASGLFRQTRKTYTKTLIVDKEKFRTFRDGEPFAFYQNGNEEWVSEWDNEYGLVPLKLAYFAEGVEGWGRNSFFGIARRQIDELNDQASLINDSIRNIVVPLLQAKGVAKASEISVAREDKDSMAIVYLSNPDSSLEPVTIPLDLGAAEANKNSSYQRLVSNLPILSLTKIRDYAGNLSGAAIDSLFGDGINVVKQTRKNLDPAVSGILQIAVTVAAVDGVQGFEAFNVNSYDNGDMDLKIAERPVVDDALSKEQKLVAFPQIASQPPKIQQQMLRVMGVSETDIQEILAEAQAEQQRKAEVAERIAQGMGNAPPNAANGADAQDEAAAEAEQQEAV